MSARLTSALLVSAIRRLAEGQGGFATLVSRGDETAGAILLLIRERSALIGLCERMPTAQGDSEWTLFPVAEPELEGLLARRRGRDPDLYIVELDIPDLTQFIPLLPT